MSHTTVHFHVPTNRASDRQYRARVVLWTDALSVRRQYRDGRRWLNPVFARAVVLGTWGVPFIYERPS